MGCFNGTCGLSQLPIKHGERVVLLFLKHQNYADIGTGGFCYSTNQYYPICPPIRGEYNDYGSIENIDDNAVSQLVFDFFGKKWGKELQLNEGEIERHESLKMSTSAANIEELVDLVSEGCLSDVGFMMVHEKLFDDIIAEMGNRKRYNKPDTFRQYITSLGQETAAQSFDKELKEYLENITDENKKLILRSLLIGESNFGREFEGEAKHFVNLLQEQKSTELLESLVDLLMFHTVMEFSRKLFTPQVGSQCNELYLHKLIGEFCVEKEKNYREACGYEEATRETLF